MSRVSEHLEHRRGRINKSEMSSTNNVAVAGPPCSNGAVLVGLLASKWNLPIVGYGGTDLRLSDKNTYDTYSRTVGQDNEIGKAFSHIAQLYKWEKVVLLTRDPPEVFTHARAGFRDHLRQNGTETVEESFDNSQWLRVPSPAYLQQFVKPLKGVGRGKAYHSAHLNESNNLCARLSVVCPKLPFSSHTWSRDLLHSFRTHMSLRCWGFKFPLLYTVPVKIGLVSGLYNTGLSSPSRETCGAQQCREPQRSNPQLTRKRDSANIGSSSS